MLVGRHGLQLAATADVVHQRGVSPVLQVRNSVSMLNKNDEFECLGKRINVHLDAIVGIGAVLGLNDAPAAIRALRTTRILWISGDLHRGTRRNKECLMCFR